MPQLTIQNGPHSGTVFRFDAPVVVGRGRGVDVKIEDPSVSRNHARLEPVADGWCLADMGSANGTFLNGRPLSRPTALQDGDLVAFGGIMAMYRAGRESSPDSRRTSAVRYIDGSPRQQRVISALPANDAAADPFAGLDFEEARRVFARRLSFLNELGRLSAEVFDEERLLAFVLDELFLTLPQAERAVMLLRDEATGELVARAARARTGPLPDVEVSRTLLQEAYQHREALLLTDAQTDQRYAAAESIRALNLRSVICAPLVCGGEAFGVLQVENGPMSAQLTRADLSLVAGIAGTVSITLAYARVHARLLDQQLIERDMMLARKVQQHFLPSRPPEVDGYAFAVRYEPAMAVGGDFYDFLSLADGRIAVAVGDVCGKGVGAALYAAKLGSELRYESVGRSEPASILGGVNNSLAAWSEEGMFVTLVLAVLEPTTGRLVVSSAGHPLPILRSTGGVVSDVDGTPGTALGMSAGLRFEQTEHRLAPGEAVLFYTDGAHEAHDARNDLFGKERLMDVLGRPHTSAADMAGAVIDAIRAFVGTSPASDDLTLLVVARNRRGETF
jgi:serine phosphatase RsbU (regulator of sigma subunit)